jgi:hypothetical protein
MRKRSGKNRNLTVRKHLESLEKITKIRLNFVNYNGNKINVSPLLAQVTSENDPQEELSFQSCFLSLPKIILLIIMNVLDIFWTVKSVKRC